MATTKKAMSIRLSDQGKRLLATLAQRQGISQTAVVEIALREYAERLGISLPSAPAPPRSPND